MTSHQRRINLMDMRGPGPGAYSFGGGEEFVVQKVNSNVKSPKVDFLIGALY